MRIGEVDETDPGLRETDLVPVVSRLLADEPPRAASFIVTLYGDVVEPRGGVLWMGTLIETCALWGISESLVRTAVSRLVAAEQLVGERVGRRSYYRLTPAARREFAAAAKRLFDPAPAPERWLILRPADAATAARLAGEGFAEIGPGLLLGPDDGRRLPEDTLVLRAETVGGAAGMRAVAEQHWELQRHAAAYRRFQERFAPLLDEVIGLAEAAGGLRLSDRSCLVARLALVHHYRGVVLRAPDLPGEALPRDWPGPAAAALFGRLYAELSRGADPYVGRHFVGQAELLPAATKATRERLRTLEPRVCAVSI